MRREGWYCAPGAALTSWEPRVTVCPGCAWRGPGHSLGPALPAPAAQTTCSSAEDLRGREAGGRRTLESRPSGQHCPHHTAQAMCPTAFAHNGLSRLTSPEGNGALGHLVRRPKEGDRWGRPREIFPSCLTAAWPIPSWEMAPRQQCGPSHLLCRLLSTPLHLACPPCWPARHTCLLHPSCGSGVHPCSERAGSSCLVRSSRERALAPPPEGSARSPCQGCCLGGEVRRVSRLSQDPVHTGPMPAADKHGKHLN